MRIVRLVAENIQRLSSVEITPDGSPVVVLAGNNENGKSSCLDAIEMALGGKDAIPAEPVRRGAEKGRVVVDLGDIVVTRKLTKDGGGSLTVTNKDGAKYPSPQALLDGLYSRLTFDPLAFATAKPADQHAILRSLASLDFTDLDLRRKQAYDERTLVNRDLTRAKAALAELPEYPDVGTEIVSLDTLTRAIEEADAVADADAKVTIEIERLRGAVRTAADRHEQAITAVEEARAALERAEIECEIARQSVLDAEKALEGAVDRPRATVPDRAALRRQVAEATARNSQAEANARRQKLAGEVQTHQQTADALTATIDGIDTEKGARLAAAKFPVDGLSLSDTGVTWQGLPFEQASTAIRTRVSVAIGFALHPKLKVLLVRNGNDLDAKNLALIAEAAAEAGGQLWLERIAGGNGLQTIVIEDGAVAGADHPVSTRSKLHVVEGGRAER